MNLKAKRNDVLCVIPARGGSVEIPHKNLRHINNFPLVSYSIQHAIANKIPLNKIVVSSDDEEILKIAQKYGVIAHRRPDELCTSTSASELALKDAVSKYGGTHIVMLQPTSPIRTIGLLNKCLYAYFGNDCDSLLTTTKLYNFLWYKYSENDTWVSTQPSGLRPMRQKLPPEEVKHFDNGNIYITHVDILNERNNRIGLKPYMYPISFLESIQIDSFEDLNLVDMILSGNLTEILTNV